METRTRCASGLYSERNNMTGISRDQESLNQTLHLVMDKLRENNVVNWFVAYGTLLGLVRDNSCIDGDDDIDILIDRSDTNIDSFVKDLTQNNNFQLFIDKKTKFMALRNDICQLDLYFSDVDADGNFFDRHEKTTWSRCFDPLTQRLPTITWQEQIVNVPHDRIIKLQKRYGENWKQRIEKHLPGGEGYRAVKVL